MKMWDVVEGARCIGGGGMWKEMLDDDEGVGLGRGSVMWWRVRSGIWWKC